VVVVWTDQETQIHRLMERGLTREEALARIQAQIPLEIKKKLADYILWGEEDIGKLRREAERIWDEVRGK